MSLPDRKDVRIRLPDDLLGKLDTICRHLGQTRQTYLSPLVRRAIEDDLADARIKSAERKTAKGSHRDGPTGLGLNFHREQEPVARYVEPAPVVVNVGGANKSDLGEMADYIVSGRDYERDSRMRDALEKLAQKLEEAVSKRTKEPEDDLAKLRRGAASLFTNIKGILG